MNDEKSDNEQSTPKKLQLTKTVETGQVQQTFARGRSKTVMVEMKRTRTFSRDGNKMVEDSKNQQAGSDAEKEGSLTEEERSARIKALEKAESSKAAKPAEAPKKEEKKPVSEKQQSNQKNVTETPTSKSGVKLATKDKDGHDKKGDDFSDEAKLSEKKSRLQSERKRNKGKLTISNALIDQEEKVRSLASIRRARQKAKKKNEFSPVEGEKTIKDVIIPETITVQELANRMAVRSQEVVRELMKLGIIATGVQVLDADTAELVVTELGHKTKRVTEADVEDILKIENPHDKDLRPRPPVVTIMGHVDHGKTSLLDALRQTNVTEGEAGGITQHIGAYQIKTKNGDIITFLDTPGHEAFTAMRARGAKVTDIVVLVVAADDGIMPQTEEAINHAKAAEVPIIVAINKIDKPGADIRKVKDALLSYELVPEDLGGDTMVVEVSAKQKTNLEKLIETILLQAEVMEIKASWEQRASGTVIEAKVDKGKGITATLLVQRGVIRLGDIVVAGTGYGKIRTMTDDKGMTIKEASPSSPIEILGLNELPAAGDEFSVVDVEKQAREIIEYRTKRHRDLHAASNLVSLGDEVTMDKLFHTAKGGDKELRLVIKADVQGSIEAIKGSLEKLSNDEVKVKVIHSAAGGIAESDITLAAAVGAKVLGFNVRASTAGRELASNEGVDIQYYSIIYNLLDDMKAIVGGLMTPVIHEKFLGNAEILKVFKMSKIGKVAGCMVKEGSVKRGAGVRLIRDNVVIHEGKLKVLKRFKDEVPEVKQGMECGMSFEKYEDIKEGDTIEAFELVEEKRKA